MPAIARESIRVEQSSPGPRVLKRFGIWPLVLLGPDGAGEPRVEMVMVRPAGRSDWPRAEDAWRRGERGERVLGGRGREWKEWKRCGVAGELKPQHLAPYPRSGSNLGRCRTVAIPFAFTEDAGGQCAHLVAGSVER